MKCNHRQTFKSKIEYHKDSYLIGRMGMRIFHKNFFGNLSTFRITFIKKKLRKYITYKKDIAGQTDCKCLKISLNLESVK